MMDARLTLFPIAGKHTAEALKRWNERGACIQPMFFKDLNVFVDSQSTDQKHSIEKAMKIVGAKVVSSVDHVDVVISPSRATVSSVRSRGTKMVLNLVQEKRPAKNVLVSEIPWVDEVIREVPQREPAVMVVADAAGRYAPHFKRLKEVPEIAFVDEQPRGFTFCPFDKARGDAKAMVQQYQQKTRRICAPGDQPPRGSFCEICGQNIETPELHRASDCHQHKADSCNWATFDKLAQRLYQAGRLTSKR